MKTIIKYFAFTFALLIAFSNSTIAQPEEDKTLIKNNLTQLFEFSKAEKYEEAAKLIVYSEDEKSRKYKDIYNMEDRKEAKQVKRICKKIKALLDITDNYTVGNFSKSKEDGLDITVLMVNFNSSGQKLNTQFEFIKVGKNFLLLSVK